VFSCDLYEEKNINDALGEVDDISGESPLYAVRARIDQLAIVDYAYCILSPSGAPLKGVQEKRTLASVVKEGKLVIRKLGFS